MNMLNKKKYRQVIKSESEILLFGKFKNCTVQHVLRTEPSYILWLDEEQVVKFPQEILDNATDNEFDNRMDEFLDETFGSNYSSYWDD